MLNCWIIDMKQLLCNIVPCGYFILCLSFIKHSGMGVYSFLILRLVTRSSLKEHNYHTHTAHTPILILPTHPSSLLFTPSPTRPFTPFLGKEHIVLLSWPTDQQYRTTEKERKKHPTCDTLGPFQSSLKEQQKSVVTFFFEKVGKIYVGCLFFLGGQEKEERGKGQSRNSCQIRLLIY